MKMLAAILALSINTLFCMELPEQLVTKEDTATINEEAINFVTKLKYFQNMTSEETTKKLTKNEQDGRVFRANVKRLYNTLEETKDHFKSYFDKVKVAQKEEENWQRTKEDQEYLNQQHFFEKAGDTFYSTYINDPSLPILTGMPCFNNLKEETENCRSHLATLIESNNFTLLYKKGINPPRAMYALYLALVGMKYKK